MSSFNVTDLLSKLSLDNNWKTLPAIGATFAETLTKTAKGDVSEVVETLNNITAIAQSDIKTSEAVLCSLLPGIFEQAGNK
jgi:hypothetical protein